MRSYFAKDGSFGDAEDMVIVDTTAWSDDDWEMIEGARESDRVRIAGVFAEEDALQTKIKEIRDALTN